MSPVTTAAPRAAAGLTSPASGVALYEGTLRHRRFGATAHTFERPVSYVYLDLDALPRSFDRLPLWSARRPALVWFRACDYLVGDDRPLADQLRSLVADRTGARPTGPVWLLTQPRRAGWLFNPMSTYFCLSETLDRVETIVLEVTNTPWHERCWYVIDVQPEQANGPWEFSKAMHVSPFLPMDLTYRLRSTAPRERLTLRLEDRRGDELVFAADLALRRVELDSRRALGSALRHPLATWQVSAGIYRHAARLWTRRVPIHRHPTRRADPVHEGARR